jgi:hypothetical protein
LVQEAAVHAVSPFGKDFVKELPNVMQVEVQTVLVQPLLNLKTGNTVIHGDERPDFGLVELLVLLSKAWHEDLGLTGVYGGDLFDYNVTEPEVYMAVKEGARDATAIDIVKIGGILAALSVLIVFLVSFGSAVFARGLLISLGFPPSAIGVKPAADMFAVISYQRCLLFMLCGLTGFIPLPWHRLLPNRLHIVLSLGLIILVIIVARIEMALDIQSGFGRIFFEFMTLLSPVIVGYSLMSVQTVERYPLAIFGAMVVLMAFGTNIRSIALSEAREVKRAGSDEDKVSFGADLAKSNKDFGIVTIIVKENLGFLTGGVKSDGGYEYEPQSTAFLRLIAEDDSRYFMIEKTDNGILPFTVRKEAVIAVMFKNVISGKAP